MKEYDIILKPVLTEKSYADIANKKYSFYVDVKATKTEIKNAVEKIFDVKVAKVNTAIIAGKQKSQDRGRTYGFTATRKKAYVTLTPDSKSIEFFDSLS